MAAGAAFFGGRAIISGLQKSIELSSKMEGLQRGFDNLTKSAGFSTQAFSKLQKATDGTISSFDLMKQANNAMLLGIADSEEQMAEMFDVAQRLASALGQDAAFGVESLVTGLGRQSKLMLDNLGIMVDVEGANKAYAKELKIIVGQLTDAERKQAFVNEAMREANKLVKSLGDEQLTTADSINRMSTAMDDMLIAIGTAMSPAVSSFAEFVTQILSAKVVSEDLTTVLTENEIELEKFKNQIKSLGLEDLIKLNESLGKSTDQFITLGSNSELTADKMVAVNEILREYTESTDELIPRFREWNDELGSIGEFATIFSEEDAPMMIDAFDIIAASLQSNVDYTKEFGEALKQAKMDAATSIGGLLGSFASLNSAAKGGFLVTARLQQAAAIANTYSSATAAIAPPPVGYGPTPMGWVAATAAIASGLANVAQIESSLSNMQSAATGFDGIVNKPTMFMTGEAGAERVSVTPLEGPNINGPQGGGITLNISAPLVDETVVDSIIPAIEKAQRLNLA